MKWNGPRKLPRWKPDRADRDPGSKDCHAVALPEFWPGVPGFTPPGMPTEPSVEFNPNGNRRGPRHQNKPPRKNEKENKSQILALDRRTPLGMFVNAATEYCDVVDALYYALPVDHRRFLARHSRTLPRLGSYDLGCSDKAKVVFNNFFNLDTAQALENLAYNFVEDYVIGKIGGLLGEGARRLNRDGTGLQVGGCARSPGAFGATETWFDQLIRSRVPDTDQWWDPGWYEPKTFIGFDDVGQDWADIDDFLRQGGYGKGPTGIRRTGPPPNPYGGKIVKIG